MIATMIGILIGWCLGFWIVAWLEIGQARKFLKWHEDYCQIDFIKIYGEMVNDRLYKEMPMK